MGNYLGITAGVLALFVGGELLVRGAVALAYRTRISRLLIGLTVVAFGTSAPELFVSLDAVARGAPSIAVGNVIGTNVANLCLVLGVAALASPIVADWRDVSRDVWVMLGATMTVPLALADGVLTRSESAFLVAALVAYVVLSYRSEMRALTAAEDWRVETVDELATVRPGLYTGALMCAGGAAGLAVGAELLVRGADGIAHSLGISEAFVGLTIVAAGTSAPELATCVVASIRGDDDIALGNAVGSNVFNILLILGITGTIAPIEAGTELSRASILLLAVTAVFALAVWRVPRIERVGGAALLGAYVTLMFLAFLI